LRKMVRKEKKKTENARAQTGKKKNYSTPGGGNHEGNETSRLQDGEKTKGLNQ